MKAMRDLVKFKHSQNHQVKGIIEAAALCDFLKGTDLEKAVLAQIRADRDAEAIPQGGDGGEHEEERVVPEVPEVPVAAGGGEDHSNHMEESEHPAHLGLANGRNPVSPVGSRSSGTTSVSGIFLQN